MVNWYTTTVNSDIVPTGNVLVSKVLDTVGETPSNQSISVPGSTTRAAQYHSRVCHPNNAAWQAGSAVPKVEIVTGFANVKVAVNIVMEDAAGGNIIQQTLSPEQTAVTGTILDFSGDFVGIVWTSQPNNASYRIRYRIQFRTTTGTARIPVFKVGGIDTGIAFPVVDVVSLLALDDLAPTLQHIWSSVRGVETLELNDLAPTVRISWPGTLHRLELNDLEPTTQVQLVWPAPLQRLEFNDLAPSVSIAWSAPLVVLELNDLAPSVSIVWSAPLVVLELNDLDLTVVIGGADVVINAVLQTLELNDLAPSVSIAWSAPLVVLELNDLDPSVSIAWSAPLVVLELNDLDPSVSIAWSAPLVVLELNDLDPSVVVSGADVVINAALQTLEFNDLDPTTQLQLVWPGTLHRLELNDLDLSVSIAWSAPLVVLELNDLDLTVVIGGADVSFAAGLQRLEVNDLDPGVLITWSAPLTVLQLAAQTPSTANEWPAPLLALELLALGASNQSAWPAPTAGLELQPLGLFLGQPSGTLFLLPLEPTVQIFVPVSVTMVATRGFLRLRPLLIMVLTGKSYALQRQRVHNALVERAGAALFPPCSYDPDTGQMYIDPVDYATVRPQTIATKDVITRFTPCRLERLTPHRRERRRWQWNLHIAFPQEVDLELFEQDLADHPIVLAPDDDLGLREVIVSLEDSKPEHPPQQGPAGGTRAVLTFEAALQPS